VPPSTRALNGGVATLKARVIGGRPSSTQGQTDRNKRNRHNDCNESSSPTTSKDGEMSPRDRYARNPSQTNLRQVNPKAEAQATFNALGNCMEARPTSINRDRLLVINMLFTANH
jgi:hypothetical protein